MNKRIFIVDDEMIIGEQLKHFLGQNGYAVELFPFGEPCLRRLNEGDIPDVILMDINLGEGRMDGTAVTKKIYQKYDIPVVLHSAYADRDTLEPTIEMPKYGYIQKVPGNEHFILATIEMALKMHSTEAELHKKEKLYHELFDNSIDAVYLCGIKNDGLPGRFLEVNQIACERLACLRTDLLHMSLYDIYAGLGTMELDRLVGRLLEQGETLFDAEHIIDGGEALPVEVSTHLFYIDGKPFILTTERDITQRKKTEEKILRSQLFYLTILGSISDTVLLTNEKEEFVYICPNVDVIFGYSKEEVAAFPGISDLLGDFFVSADQLQKEKEIRNQRLIIYDKQGKKHILLVNIKRVNIGDGTRLYTFRDISELSEKEQALQKSEQMYRELSVHYQNVREEQGEELSREIHDDLGQALTALRMNLIFLDQTLNDDEVNKKDVERAIKDMERITNSTIRKVRKISTELRPSVIDTEGIIEALDWQIQEFRKNFSIPVAFTKIDREIELGKRKSLHVFRIVQESLTNCIRHSGANQIHISTAIQEGLLCITICDNGTGFDTSAVPEDSGYGLFGMQERAIQCDGRVLVESEPGIGTSIQIEIPMR